MNQRRSQALCPTSVRLRSKEPAVRHSPRLRAEATAEHESGDPRQAGVRNARHVGEVATSSMAPDHLISVVALASPPSELVEVVDEWILDARVEADVQHRLIPAEVRAVAKGRRRVLVEAAIQPDLVTLREPERTTRDAILEGSDDDAAVEV